MLRRQRHDLIGFGKKRNCATEHERICLLSNNIREHADAPHTLRLLRLSH
jgi:hypothetical protein